MCPSFEFAISGRGSSTTSPPRAVCPNVIENILFDFLPVAKHGGPCQINPPHSDFCISSSFGFTQIDDAPESTTAVGIVRAMVVLLFAFQGVAWNIHTLEMLQLILLVPVVFHSPFLLSMLLWRRFARDAATMASSAGTC